MAKTMRVGNAEVGMRSIAGAAYTIVITPDSELRILNFGLVEFG